MTTDLRLTDEPIGFSAGELVKCPRCDKPNGPDRNACLYCGETLPLTTRNSDAKSLHLRRLDTWEPGFSLVVLSKAAVVDSDVSAAAKLICAEKDFLVSMLDSDTPLPLARVESKELAEEAVENLSALGFAAAIIDESELKLEQPPIRLRNLSMDASQLVLTHFNSEKLTTIHGSEMVLIVTGRIVQSRRDEVTKRKKGKSTVVDETETGSDLRMIDIYTSADVIGYRIQTNGFDFSVLGGDKGIFANENIEKLADLLRRHCLNAIFADEYDSVRSLLNAVWEPETRKVTQVRVYDKRKYETTYTSSNLSQFTKYSRMRRALI